MPRARIISDASLLDAALVILRSGGPAALSFGRLAEATALAPATLVQRFGGKDALVEAALMQAWDRLDERTATLDGELPVDDAGAVELLVRLTTDGDHEEHADGLLLLREDFRNPRLRERGGRWGDALAMALGRRLASDLETRKSVGRALANQWQGALIWWGFERVRPIEDHVRSELAAYVDLLRSTARR